MHPDLPRPPRALVVTTEALLGVLFLVGLGTIAVLPGVSADIAALLPEYAALRTPLLALSIAITVLGLIAVGMVALLVRRIHSGTMLAAPSLLRVDLLVATVVCIAMLIVAAFFVISNGQAGSPFIALLQAISCLTLAAAASITLVLRFLLRDAIAMRAELDEVV